MVELNPSRSSGFDRGCLHALKLSVIPEMDKSEDEYKLPLSQNIAEKFKEAHEKLLKLSNTTICGKIFK